MNTIKRAAQGGFTLIELLLVIVILGILAGVVITVINPAAQQNRARDAVLKSSMEKIGLAINADWSAYQRYPSCADLNSAVQQTVAVVAGQTHCNISSGGLPRTIQYQPGNGRLCVTEYGQANRYWRFRPQTQANIIEDVAGGATGTYDTNCNPI